MALSILTQAIFTALLSNLTSRPDTTSVLSPSSPNLAEPEYANTSYGIMKGAIRCSKSGLQVRVFHGVPYAQPPIGNLRFQPPKPPSSWSGIFDTTRFGPKCEQDDTVKFAQTDAEGNAIPTKEDCLYLNVYTPNRKGEQLLPVMLWIHGGGFNIGSGSSYDATSLSAKGAVVVTINYRLNLFGFLSTEDSSAPGNYGLMDQVMALKWVRQNIRSFGGDANMLTIFGASSGSISVSLLTLSPLTTGLFQRAIMHSGTSLSLWAVSRKSDRIRPKQIASLLGSRVNCFQKDSPSLVQCLRRVDAQDLINASKSIQHVSNAGVVYKHRVEGINGFLPDLPYSILARGQYNKVGCIIGSDRVEAPFNDPDNKGASNADFERIVTTDINGDNILIGYQRFYDIIKNMYLKNSSDPHFIRDQLQQFRSDLYFYGPSLIEIGLRSKKYPSTRNYLYKFTYQATNSQISPWSAPAHGRDVPYVLNVSKELQVILDYPKDLSSRDLDVAEHMQEAWLHFDKHGAPAPSTNQATNDRWTWTRYSTAFPFYLDINHPSRLKLFTRQQEIKLIKELLFRYDFHDGAEVAVVG